MKNRTSAITALVLVFFGLILRFVFSGHNFIAYGLFFVAFLIFLYEKCSKNTKRIVSLVLALGIVYFSIIEIPIIQASKGDGDFDADYVIVLGAAVHGDTPSLSLTERLEAALSYLTEHPDTLAIVSGGKGGGENLSEAEAMYNWLCDKGIEPSRIIKEDKATSTYENLKYSFEIISSVTDKAEPVVGIISSEYHLYRAKLLAYTMGEKVLTVPAHTTYLSVRLNYFIREAFGVTYQLLFN